MSDVRNHTSTNKSLKYKYSLTLRFSFMDAHDFKHYIMYAKWDAIFME